jgi:hypothetical protein
MLCNNDIRDNSVSRPTDTCRLCLKVRPLCKSHLVPKANFKTLRATGKKNPHPLLISGGVVRTTSAQTQEYLLCDECEQRLRINGEDWVLSNCYRGEGEFNIRKVLLAAEPWYGDQDIQIFKASAVPEIAITPIIYFGLSVFWRAAVRDWRLPGVPIIRIDLGPYEEPLRRYLLAESAFPDRMALNVGVSSTTDVASYFILPMSGNDSGFHYHKFSVPGMQFLLFVGSRMPAEFQVINTAPATESLISVYPRAEQMEIADLAQLLQRRRESR